MAAQKEFVIELAENQGTLYRIRFGGGGQVPHFLDGLYTSRPLAQQRIDQYLVTEKRGAKPNGKTTG